MSPVMEVAASQYEILNYAKTLKGKVVNMKIAV